MDVLELKDLQGILVRGYGDLGAAWYVVCGVDDAVAARRWLGALAPQVTDGETRPSATALNIAFTHAGLTALGLDAAALATFPSELREGMFAEHRRHILGDYGESSPETWDWGGPQSEPVHLLLLIYAADEPTLEAFYASLLQGPQSSGVHEIYKLPATVIMRDETGCVKEHFGFCDAISQPIIEGLSRAGTSATTVNPGEFILGYTNEYELLTERPLVSAERDGLGLLPEDAEGSGQHDLGRNGTYLVLRQLRQNVHRFWQFLLETTRDGQGNLDPDACIKLASKMVGRWPSGAPLVKSPDHDSPDLGGDNEFAYHHADPDGLKCPIGSHIRRANPRDSLDPEPGSQQSLDVNKRHRILRRGRAYGPPVAPSFDLPDIWKAEPSPEERGLHFVCLNANISRQFEFVQQTWINNPKFAGLYEDVDPLVGDRDPHAKVQQVIFTQQDVPVRRRLSNLPQFVAVRGGAYFFLPSIRAIHYLAALS